MALTVIAVVQSDHQRIISQTLKSKKRDLKLTLSFAENQLVSSVCTSCKRERGGRGSEGRRGEERKRGRENPEDMGQWVKCLLCKPEA